MCAAATTRANGESKSLYAILTRPGFPHGFGSLASALFASRKATHAWFKVDLARVYKEWLDTSITSAATDMKTPLNQTRLQEFALSEQVFRPETAKICRSLQAYYGYGGFGEDRTELWKSIGETGIHIGVDFNGLEKDEKIHAIDDCKVFHVFRDESKMNGWGGRVITRSSSPNSRYVLYGHLHPESLPKEGASLKKGDLIGTLAEADKNGGWFRHLHLQVMTQKFIDRFAGKLEEIDGYAKVLPPPDEVIDPLTIVW